jgi:5'-nucleotidase
MQNTKPKNHKPILLVDMDGVAANYYAKFVEIWKAKYPERVVLEPEELTSMYFESTYPKEYEADIRAITTDIGFFEALPVMEGAAEALNKILDNGDFDPYLCSTPDSHSVDHCCPSEKMRWTEIILGKRWLKRLILTHDKTLIHGDYLIDDKPDITGVNPHPSWQQVYFTHAYNKDKFGIRLDSWAKWPKLEQPLLDHFYRDE